LRSELNSGNGKRNNHPHFAATRNGDYPDQSQKEGIDGTPIMDGDLQEKFLQLYTHEFPEKEQVRISSSTSIGTGW
jgi:hypothetical protein